mmetsp:Transcript_40439/g.41250  ORF Transcript_40439/g.41250 Transcript_40439/m.41250 type:complete len:969 (+) Transcript_40439:134-3040(+)|eukprot:CAMPEP_0182432044 /NCGR_PEP_ID=MMETSP1167-20130531/53544_1 /TAXON_ID=2988 /ORGANISM="Mallomonas Sp, Strain CCMP3275" /LENGTH=968 /DNA_ID=CAMNT_0024619079 /DNA_START=59 /DNA_END=2965 /DNA_ORIENTATION=-
MSMFFNRTAVAPPTNYVAGVGRGAQGFTTRSDIGPARPAAAPTASDIQFGVAPVGYVAGRGRGMGDLARDQGDAPQVKPSTDDDRGDYSESNYDEFAGYSEKLFSRGTPYEEDDEEADIIYEAVDDRMDSRRKRRRELQMVEDMKRNRNNRPKIADQFADLKRELADVTVEQWDSLPEVGDHSLKHKQKNKRNEVFTPVPDYLLASSSAKNAVSNTLDARAQLNGGFETPLSGGTSTVTGMAEARGTVLSLKLDKMSDSVSGQTVVDPRGYLTDLNSLKITSDAEIGDIKKARTLLNSVTSTNPKHGPGWIAAARVEEYAGKIVQARKVMAQGCEACPESEDVWLEAARLHTNDNAKVILANAVRHLPGSVKIWLKAADLETREVQKKVVLRRALEFIPNSVKLWKTAIELEEVEDARIMLARAVECVPHSVDMWLALAKLETYENARKVLNQAREAIPTEPAIWITASKLEEAHGNVNMVDRIIEKAIASLRQYQVAIDREQWLKEAEAVEAAGAPHTCGAIVRNVIHIGVEDEDRKKVWVDDADVCLSRVPPAKETARAIYKHALSVFPGRKNIWLAAANLEKEHGTAESLESILKEGVKYCPQAEVLWLMAAKEKWLSGDVSSARAILIEAFEANPDSEQIWLAAVKLEWENNEYARARILLSKARDRASSERIWMKSALLEREVRDIPAELVLLEEGVRRYPSFEKFYLMAGQACDEVLSDATRAREFYQQGLKQNPSSVPLWRAAVKLECRTRGVEKARGMLELARIRLPKNEWIWLESIRLERGVNEKQANILMARALQECPNSGILWAEDISTCPQPQQKSKSVDALKRCDNDPYVIVAVARLFDKDRKYAKARKWFNRAVTLAPDLGDAWAYFYSFELQQCATEAASSGTGSGPGPVSSTSSGATAVDGKSLAEDVLNRCVAADPRHGELWCAVSKQTEYRRLDTANILKRVVERLLQKI